MRALKSLAPIADKGATVLILGSMPGRKSLEMSEYYAHPANQCWRILAEIFRTDSPATYIEKMNFLKLHSIALWDVLSTCTRKASEDASIRQAAPNKIQELLRDYPNITTILLNGKAAEKYFTKHFEEIQAIAVHYVPSTSPAYASLSFEKKVKEWELFLKR